MKASILYHSQTGTTKELAQKIAEGMASEGLEVKAFSIGDLDAQWIKDSCCVIVGSPTYYADVSAQVKTFLETFGKYDVAGKLGGAFATAGFSYGGGDLALQTILHHMLFWGMLVYSGGGSQGTPPSHLGPVASGACTDAGPDLFVLYGQRMARRAKEIF